MEPAHANTDFPTIALTIFARVFRTGCVRRVIGAVHRGRARVWGPAGAHAGGDATASRRAAGRDQARRWPLTGKALRARYRVSPLRARVRAGAPRGRTRPASQGRVSPPGCAGEYPLKSRALAACGPCQRFFGSNRSSVSVSVRR
jgi:hypothetical protein